MVDAPIRKRVVVALVALCAIGAVLCFRRADEPASPSAPVESSQVDTSVSTHDKVLSPVDVRVAELLAAKLDAKMTDDEKQSLVEKGILCNSDKSLSVLRRDPSVILMRNAIIDTATLKAEGRGIDIPAQFVARKDTSRFIVLFSEAISQKNRDLLSSMGASVEGYLPNRALAVTADADTIAKIRGMGSVSHIEPYHPFFKMSADVQEYLAGGQAERSRLLVEKGDYKLILFSGDDAEDGLKNLGVDYTVAGIGGHAIADVHCQPDLLDDLVQLDGVRWVEAVAPMKVLNDMSSTTTRAGPTKASIPGLDGSGVIIAVVDTGVDFEHAGFSIDPNLPTSTNINTRILDYIYVPGGGSSDGLPGDTVGHGTHVAASILGNGGWSTNVNLAPGSGPPPYTTNQFAGMAPNAQLIMLEDFNSMDHTQICWTAYQKGARISNNSWGAAIPDYNIMSMMWDFLVRDANNDPADGLQPYTCFFAAGNSGDGPNDGQGGFGGTVGAFRIRCHRFCAG